MQIKSTSGTGNFEIKNENDERVLELIYSNWFASNAKTSYKSNNIEIKPKNFWASKFDILKNELDIGDLTFNWKGDVVIQLTNSEQTENNYLLRAKGFWKMAFELLDGNEVKILSLRPNFNWKKVGYDYEIELANNVENQEEIMELLIFSGFGANLYMTRMMSQ